MEAVRETKRHFVFVGTSHTNAVRQADDIRRAVGASGTIIEVVHLRAPQFNPVSHGATDDDLLGSAVMDFIARRVAARARIVSCLNGNHHNVIGLMMHPEPFDFSLPGVDGLPLATETRIVPYEQLRASMLKNIERELEVLRQLKATAQDLVHVQSPPPIFSEAHILEYYFRRRNISKLGVTPPYVRFKLWRLYSSLVEETCRSVGIRFLASPPDVFDDKGFLHPDGYPKDATHGNAWYGERIIRMLEEQWAPIA